MQTKQECQNQFRKLKVKIQNFDCDILKMFPFAKTTILKNEILNMITQQEKKNFDQEKERHDIFNQIFALKKEIKKFQDKIKTCDNQNRNDFLLKIQELSESLGQKVTIFKEKQMLIFEQLQEDEEILSNDLQTFYEKQNKYENNVVNMQQIQEANESDFNSDYSQSNSESNDQIQEIDDNFKVQKIEKKLEKLKNEVEKIDKLIKVNGGYYCGWAQEDHLDFLKLKTKFKDQIKDPSFLKACLSRIPIYSEDQIQDHIQNFLKYSKFETQKKEILEQYKNQKQQRDQIEIDRINQKNQREKDLENLFKVQKQEKEKIKQEQLKQELNDWKIKKQSQIEVKNEIKEIEIIEKSKGIQEKNNIERLAKQQMIQEFKEQKNLQQKLKQEREQYLKSIKQTQIDPQEQLRLLEKEQKLLEKKKSLILMKQEKQMQIQKRKETLLTQQNPKFENIESKFNEHTVASKDKYRLKFDPTVDSAKHANTFGGNLLHLQRAIPNWRQNQ